MSTTIEITSFLFYSLIICIILLSIGVTYLGCLIFKLDRMNEEQMNALAERNDEIHGLRETIKELKERIREMKLDYVNEKLIARDEIKVVSDFMRTEEDEKSFQAQASSKKKLSSMSTNEVRRIYQDPKASEFEHEAAWMELTSRRGQLSDRGVASYSSGRPGMVPI